ncbi:hypothetical protein [Roseibium album]|uniref:hypothetical protein n=1 Tax=Roseibium album TaxID=311410 RepID=UPI003296C7BE
MYNPREATEDRHTHNLAILCFAGFVCLVAVYFHYDSGLKYWLLEFFGEKTPGTILSIQDMNHEQLTLKEALHKSPRNTLKNSTHRFTHDVLVVEVTQPGNAPQVLTFWVPGQWSAGLHSDQISITYLPVNPKIAYPTDLLENFSFDGKLLVWSLIAGAVILFLAMRTAQSWNRFRNGMRHY